MRLKKLNVELVRLPSDIKFALYLIKEDLKSNRLLNRLSKIGFDDSFHRSDFCTVILAAIGFEERADDLYALYNRLLDKQTEKLGDDNTKIVRAAFNIYVDLVIENKKRAKGVESSKK